MPILMRSMPGGDASGIPENGKWEATSNHQAINCYPGIVAAGTQTSFMISNPAGDVLGCRAEGKVDI